MSDNEGTIIKLPVRRIPWNKGKPIGAKPPLRPSHVWSIRMKLQIENRKRDLALSNLAIDSKPRGYDVVAIRVEDVAPSGYAMDRATVLQRTTGRPAGPVRVDGADPAGHRRISPADGTQAGTIPVRRS